MSLKPSLSVFMPNFNHGRFLPESLEAILSQSYRPKEIVVIDDASTDNSFEILQEFARKYQIIRVIRNEQNLGPLENVNRLLELVTGDYVYGAAADDKILPDFFEKSMELLSKYPKAGLCSTLSRAMDENGKDKGVFPSPVIANRPCFISPQESLQKLKKFGSWIKGNTTIYRREALLSAGGFIPKLESHTDGFIQQVIALRNGVCFIPRALACVRELPTCYSAVTSLNVERSRAIVGHVIELMTTEYRDLFPSDYVDCFEQRLLWSASVSSWYTVRRWQEYYLAQANTLLNFSPSWMDKPFQAWLRLSIRIQAMATLLYWSLKSGSLALWLFHRWFNRAK